ncbi:carbohydrate esterase family 4 protein [Mycena crocata]|nr:carbohydrate esterase family 4 protein [Mycena crocata]
MLASLILTVLTAACASAHGTHADLGARQGGGKATVYSSCKNKGDVALTFDDGPWYYIYDMSKTLKAAGALGTFFFNGNNYGCIYDADMQKRVKYAYAQGHLIGSHTWAHKNLTTLTWDQIHDEMWRVEQALQRIIGVTPAFMRPPYGSYNDLVRQASFLRGQSLAIWDFDSGDSAGKTVAQSKALYDGVAKSKPSTLLSLGHETYETTALRPPFITHPLSLISASLKSHTVLPYAISKLQAAGYKLVTLDKCLGLPAYQSVKAPGTPDASWKC